MFLTTRCRSIAIVFWLCAFIAIPIWNRVDPAGYDIAIYHNAIVSLHAGHDPYVDAMAIQDAFHRTVAQHPHAYPPYSYVYTPLTLPLLRLMGHLPTWLACSLYWLILIAGVFSVLWVTTRARERTEIPFITLIAPLAVFCPGLLAHDTILSGNVAFILYALVLLGAYIGWTRNTWRWCYLAILVASCFKPPLLTLLAIPFFSARRQWLPAGATAGLGLGIFAAQSRVTPTLFLHFMQAVQLQFTYNNDFGSSPAGVFSNFLVHHGVAYSPASLVFYALYAAAIASVLFYLSRQYLNGDLTLQQWMPVLLTGTILLNPRIMEYDAAPIAIPMALIAWRFFTRDGITTRAVLNYLGLVLAANLVAVNVAAAWKPTECLLLATVFSTGAWSLLQPSEATLPQTADLAEIEAEEDLVPA
jgi:Glycosyltransferase family 87